MVGLSEATPAALRINGPKKKVDLGHDCEMKASNRKKVKWPSTIISQFPPQRLGKCMPGPPGAKSVQAWGEKDQPSPPRKSQDAPLYRGTSLIRNNPLLGPYSTTIPRVLWQSWGGGCFL